MPKKGKQEIFFGHSTGANYLSSNEKKVSHLTICLKICKLLSGIREWNKHLLPFVHISIKKWVWEPFLHLLCDNGSKCGISMDCPVLRPIIRPWDHLYTFQLTNEFGNHLYTFQLANEFGNHFRIFSVIMVQSAESAWTVLYWEERTIIRPWDYAMLFFIIHICNMREQH